MASKTQNCRKNRANWEKRLFIKVSVTPKLIESVEISHAPKSLLHRVIYVHRYICKVIYENKKRRTYLKFKLNLYTPVWDI